jgi:hypothetical protein
MRTTFPRENGENSPADMDLTQETAQSEREAGKFPMKIKYRGHVLAGVNRPSKSWRRKRDRVTGEQ